MAKVNKFTSPAIAPQEVAVRYDEEALTLPWSVVGLDGEILYRNSTCVACERWAIAKKLTLIDHSRIATKRELSWTNEEYRRLNP
jgi:hypothetical protein